MTESIVELEGISIRQLQHIRSNWLACKQVEGRLDRMNCYIWDGAEWAAAICRDYYNMHIRPLEAELFDITEVAPELRERGAAWLIAEDKARGLGLKHWLKEGFDRSSFPAPSGLDGLRYFRRKKGLDSD